MIATFTSETALDSADLEIQLQSSLGAYLALPFGLIADDSDLFAVTDISFSACTDANANSVCDDVDDHEHAAAATRLAIGLGVGLTVAVAAGVAVAVWWFVCRPRAKTHKLDKVAPAPRGSAGPPSTTTTAAV